MKSVIEDAVAAPSINGTGDGYSEVVFRLDLLETQIDCRLVALHAAIGQLDKCVGRLTASIALLTIAQGMVGLAMIASYWLR